jgi:hypothetical protein
MTTDELIEALALPRRALVEQCIPKKLLIENGAPTTSDKRQINEGIETLQWIAALKPATIAVAAYRDMVRDYVEIAVLQLSLSHEANEKRLVELVHRAVPYPVVLVTEGAHGASLSLADKRWSEVEVGATVLDGEIVGVTESDIGNDSLSRSFRDALALNLRPRATLLVLYRGWIDVVLALRAARVSGVFELPESAERAEARRLALAECARLEADMAAIHAAADKEEQMARKVEMNLTLQRLRKAHAAALGRL